MTSSDVDLEEKLLLRPAEEGASVAAFEIQAAARLARDLTLRHGGTPVTRQRRARELRTVTLAPLVAELLKRCFVDVPSEKLLADLDAFDRRVDDRRWE